MTTSTLPPDAIHGRRSTYLRGCPCAPCGLAHARWTKGYRSRVAQHDPSLPIPAGPVAEHVTMLLRTMSITALAAAAGVPTSTVRRVRSQARVRPATAAALLAVRPARATGRHYVDATGSRRRMQALAAMGWAPARVAGVAGLTRQLAVGICRGRVQWVWASTADSVRAAYDELSMRPFVPSSVVERGHQTRLRTLVAAQGWVPPLAWDDDTIDDPAAVPHGQVPEPGDGSAQVDDAVLARVLAGTPHATTAAERAVLVPELAARGLSDHQIAALCRVSSRTVLRTRRGTQVPTRWRTAA